MNWGSVPSGNIAPPFGNIAPPFPREVASAELWDHVSEDRAGSHEGISGYIEGAAAGMGLLLMALAIQEQQREKAIRQRVEWGLACTMGVVHEADE